MLYMYLYSCVFEEKNAILMEMKKILTKYNKNTRSNFHLNNKYKINNKYKCHNKKKKNYSYYWVYKYALILLVL